MHAAPHRGAEIQLGKRGAAALLVILSLTAAACSAGGSDNPSLSGPSTTFRRAAAGSGGPAVSIARVQGIPVPQLAGQGVANGSLRTIGLGLRGTCAVATTRDDPKLASFRWTCGTHVTGATFSLADGGQLSLGDMLRGSYAKYLSSTAAAQLEANGAVNPSTSNLSAWDLTPYALEVVFPAGTVAFPISSLAPYFKHPGPLAP